VKYVVGEFGLLVLIGSAGVILSIGMAIMFGVGPGIGRFTKNFCLGHTEVFEVK
jgi:hypothetical protein